MTFRRLGLYLGYASIAACGGLDLEARPDIVQAIFDPDEPEIPLPSNVVRDDEAGQLDFDLEDEELNVAEIEFFTYMNTLDGWPSTLPSTVEFTSAISLESVTEDTVQVWRWGDNPERVHDLVMELSKEGRELRIEPPADGWLHGETYLFLVRGGTEGVRGAKSERVEADAAFYYLRLRERLDTPEHERAFPGDTRAERQDKAADLEEIRAELQPYFEFFEKRGVAREGVASLWAFTVTRRAELAMDDLTARAPVPIDLVIDPFTGKVDLPEAADDSELVREAKRRLRDYDGFGTTSNITFEFTAGVSPSSLDERIELYELGADTPTALPVEVRMIDDRYVVVQPQTLPLKESTRYAVVVRTGIEGEGGEPAVAMPPGHFLTAQSPIAIDGESQLGLVDNDDAVKVENVRLELVEFLDQIGREGILTAWPFTTMGVTKRLQETLDSAERLKIRLDPENVATMSTVTAGLDFPLAATTMFLIDNVYTGTIASPNFLDETTRARRKDGKHEILEIPFVMTIPRSAGPSRPLPVVIFGHGLMTERRFALVLADALALHGMASIGIDLPYHGSRTYCMWNGPLCYPDPLSKKGELVCPDPCQPGMTCIDDGSCVDENGEGNYTMDWPLLDYPQASGAAFTDMEKIWNTRDHFEQALIDLSALTRSLTQGDWAATIGYTIDTTQIYYVGQSLGGILGATFVPMRPEIKRAVLNVAGVDIVDMFIESLTFSHLVDAVFAEEGIEPGSYDEERFLNFARMFMTPIEALNVVGRLADREVMAQMALLDFVVPNRFTELLSEKGAIPRRDYLTEHGFLTIPLDPEFLRGTGEMAAFLAGAFTP